MFIIDKEQEICMFSLHVLIVHIDSVVFWQLSVLGNQVTDFPSISDDFKHQDPFNPFLPCVLYIGRLMKQLEITHIHTLL